MSKDYLETSNGQDSTNIQILTYEANNERLLQQRRDEIKNLIARTNRNIIEIGEKLHEVKKVVGHGNFGKWLKTEFNWSIATATKMMQAYQAFKFVEFTNLKFSPSAMYLLAAPSTPVLARREALDKAKQGTPITYVLAKQIVKHHKSKINSYKSLEEVCPDISWHPSLSFETRVDLEFFEKYMMREWLRLRREKKFFSLVICQLEVSKDPFLNSKREVFSEMLSQEINDSLNRPTDIFTQYKSGVFLILLPNTSEEALNTITQKIQTEINLKKTKIADFQSGENLPFFVNFRSLTLVPDLKSDLKETILYFILNQKN